MIGTDYIGNCKSNNHAITATKVCVCRVSWFYGQNPHFIGSSNTINIGLIVSTIYMFIPVSDCVGRGPSELLCPGAYCDVRTTLNIGTS